MIDLNFNALWRETCAGFKKYRIWTRLAKMAIDVQYKQNSLGPLWISVATGILIFAFSIVYGQMLNVEFKDHVIYVGSGMVFWYFFSSVILQGSNIIIASRQMVLQLPLPVSVYILKLIFHQILILKYNLLILLAICLLYKSSMGLEILVVIPAFILILLNVYVTVFLISIIATRFRDVVSGIQALMGPMMFLTPVIWSADTLAARPAFVTYNPIFHLVEIWRSPIIGSPFPYDSWAFVIVMTVIIMVAANIIFSKYQNRIAFWI